jgi:hypothetical protein
MEISIRKLCVDCGTGFDDPHDLFRKCVPCRERDQCYKERAIQDSIEIDIDASIEDRNGGGNYE